MKDTEVHIGLSQKEIRDTYQELLVGYTEKDNKLSNTYQEKKTELYKNPIDKTDFGYLRLSIKQRQNELEYAKGKLDLAEMLLGLQLMIRHFGWEEHDMSEYVGASGLYFRSFIGSKQEFENFIKQFTK